MRDAIALDPALEPAATAGRTMVRRDPLVFATAAALLLGLVNRLFGGLDTPLWFDETFTAVIASQPTIGQWLHWCLNELSGPVYYGAVFLWEKVAGNSDLALRIPGFAASVAAPLLILWRGPADRKIRLLWASASALWLPGYYIATEARPYGLLFLLSTLQAIAFLRLIEKPRTGTAMLWTSLSVLAVLTHYHAAVICGIQGLLYLAIHRGAALRTWPALLPLVPMAGWMAFHLPMLLRFAQPDVVWFAPLPPSAIILAPRLIVGPILPGAFLLLLMLGTWTLAAVAMARRRGDWPYSRAETALAASCIIGFALVFGLGFFKASFAPRYILPAIPGILFAIALWAARLEAKVRHVGPVLIALMCGWSISVLIDRLANPTDDRRHGFNFEEPSRWMAEREARRMIFYWDNPTSTLSDSQRMGEIPAFFLHRAGYGMSVDIPPWREGDVDPNRMLPALVRDTRTAILWIYDTDVPGTHAIRHPNRIDRDPLWQCRNFGEGNITVLACIYSPSTTAAARPPFTPISPTPPKR